MINQNVIILHVAQECNRDIILDKTHGLKGFVVPEGGTASDAVIQCVTCGLGVPRPNTGEMYFNLAYFIADQLGIKDIEDLPIIHSGFRQAIGSR